MARSSGIWLETVAVSCCNIAWQTLALSLERVQIAKVAIDAVVARGLVARSGSVQWVAGAVILQHVAITALTHGLQRTVVEFQHVSFGTRALLVQRIAEAVLTIVVHHQLG